MKYDFSDKTVIITGANRGIGLEILKSFALLNANILTVTRIIDEEFNKICKTLMQKNMIKIKNFQADFANEDSIKKVAKEIITEENKIDILVNNVGIAEGSLFNQTTIETIKKVFMVNIFSTMLLTQYISKIMIRNKCGIIINIGSNSGIHPRSGMSAYGSSKSALMFWGKILSKELGNFGIRVNSIAPGVTKTNMFNKMSQNFTDEVLKNTPTQKFNTPSDISDLVIFLSSEFSNNITGQIIVCDGGEV